MVPTIVWGTPRVHCRRLVLVAAIVGLLGGGSSAAEPDMRELARQFAVTVQPFLRTYCQECHAGQTPKAKLDLTRFTGVAEVAKGHPAWELMLQRLEAGEMPPEEAKRRPTTDERQAVVRWIKDFRA